MCFGCEVERKEVIIFGSFRIYSKVFLFEKYIDCCGWLVNVELFMKYGLVLVIVFGLLGW